MALTTVPPALLTSTTGTGTTVALSASPTFTGTVTTPGVTFSDASIQTAASSPYVLKNRIINGAMQVWQRGTSFTVTGGAVTYTTDRFGSYTNNTNMTISRNTSVPTTAGSLFPYSLQLQRPASSTQTYGLYLTQVIESVNCYDLAGQSVTLSFWAKAGANFSASGSSISASIVTGTVADQSTLSLLSGTWTGLAATTYTPTITTSWTKYTLTGAIPSNVLEIGLQFYFNPTGTAGADDSLYITGIQLEIGTTATPFERRLYGQELINCQRYCYRITNTGATNNGSPVASGLWSNATLVATACKLPVTMRSAPTLSYSAIGDIQCLDRDVAWRAGSSSLVINEAGVDGVNVGLVCTTGSTQGFGTVMEVRVVSGWIQFSAEL